MLCSESVWENHPCGFIYHALKHRLPAILSRLWNPINCIIWIYIVCCNSNSGRAALIFMETTCSQGSLVFTSSQQNTRLYYFVGLTILQEICWLQHQSNKREDCNVRRTLKSRINRRPDYPNWVGLIYRPKQYI